MKVMKKAAGATGLTASAAFTKVAETTELKPKAVKAVVTNYLQLAAIELNKNGKFKLGGVLNMKLKKKPAKATRKGVNQFTNGPCVFMKVDFADKVEGSITAVQVAEQTKVINLYKQQVQKVVQSMEVKKAENTVTDLMPLPACARREAQALGRVCACSSSSSPLVRRRGYGGR